MNRVVIVDSDDKYTVVYDVPGGITKRDIDIVITTVKSSLPGLWTWEDINNAVIGALGLEVVAVIDVGTDVITV